MTRKSLLTSRRTQSHRVPEDTNSRAARQARRLNRQQKRLEQEMGFGVELQPIAMKSRAIKLDDIKQLEPMTETQSDFFDAWEDDQATGYVLFGVAGSGKTICALYHAICDVLDPNLPQYQKVVIVRSAVQSRDSGFLPGTEAEKMEIYEAPYHGILEFLTDGNKGAYQKLKDMGKIDFISTGYTRGTTFGDAIVIVDEVQNMSWTECHTLATRVGKNCKIVFCGDGKQDDLHYKKNDTSGFKDFLEVSRQVASFRHFKFTVDDVVRSGFVKEWILACDRLGM